MIPRRSKISTASVITVVQQQNEFKEYVGEWGYFYVANQTIVAAHLIDSKAPKANLVSVGRVEREERITTSYKATIRVRNVSQWMNGYWNEVGKFSNMNIEQETIISDGKVIQAKELQNGERVYILYE